MRLPSGTLRQNQPGWVRNGTRASAPGRVQAPGIAIAHEYFDQFLPAGGSCGRVQDALHPLHPLSAPDRRRSFSTWARSGSNGSCGFSRIVQSPLPVVCWRHRPLEGNGGALAGLGFT